MSISPADHSRIGSQPLSIPAFVSRRPALTGIAAAAAALAVAALVNHGLAGRAEADNRPTGRFVEVDGVRLHYVERGTGEPLVLLHGNGSMIQDFELLARTIDS